MTEQEVLVAMAKRLEAAGAISEVDYPTETRRELCYLGKGWHSYYVRFRFDEHGAVVDTAAGC